MVLRYKAFLMKNGTDIVNGVDICLRRGEVMGLIGESGAGKVYIGFGCNGIHSTRVSNY
jgi:ABC-type dipeptide/oligopeptide/nickel transport system ATPase component